MHLSTTCTFGQFFGLRAGGDAPDDRQHLSATAIGFQGLGRLVQLQVTTHQTLIDCLGQRIQFESAAIAVDGLIPLTEPLKGGAIRAN